MSGQEISREEQVGEEQREIPDNSFPPGTSSPIVLGGGMAGIAAATLLAAGGLRPTLIESRPYLGGRVRSFIHAATGDEIDNGQHLMMGCYHATFRLLEMLGTRHLVGLEPALEVEFRDRDGWRDLLQAPHSLPSPLDVLAGMLRLRGLSIGERMALLRVGLAVRFGRPSPGETVRAYLERLGQSRRAQERLWDPIVIATLNTPPQEASAALFAEVMRRAFLGGGTDSHLAFPLAGLSGLLDPAKEYIESRGGRVCTGMPVTAIEREADGLYAIRPKEGQPLRTRDLLLALPERALRPLLRGEELADALLPPASSFSYSPIVSLYLWFDRPLEDIPRFAALVGTNVQWMFNRRKLGSPANPRFPGLLSCTISAAFAESGADAAEVAMMAEEELRRAFPEMKGTRRLDALVIKEKHATFAATPGAESVRPRAKTAWPGLSLAGDWTATGLPATIEGAVQSGFAAAEELIRKGR